MSKFKVGDKVQRGRHIGEVLDVSEDGSYVVGWPNFMWDGYGDNDLTLVQDASPRAWIADMIADAPPRIEVEYVIEEARKRVHSDWGGYWDYPLQDTITERLADGWTLREVLPYGNKGVKFMVVFEREVSDEDMTPFNDRPDAVGGR